MLEENAASSVHDSHDIPQGVPQFLRHRSVGNKNHPDSSSGRWKTNCCVSENLAPIRVTMSVGMLHGCMTTTPFDPWSGWTIPGWWFGCHFLFPIYWVSNHPNWLIFFRGVAQPPTRVATSLSTGQAQHDILPFVRSLGTTPNYDDWCRVGVGLFEHVVPAHVYYIILYYIILY